MFEIRTSNPILRTPNRRDPDYFDAYENPSLDQIPFYQSLLTRLYQCFYFLSGPKFLVPFIGKCSKFEIDIAIIDILRYIEFYTTYKFYRIYSIEEFL